MFNGESSPSLPTIFFYSSPIIFVCNWVPLPYPILANSISSNYSVLVHCNVPANNLKCAGGGCSLHLHAPCGGNLMWRLWHGSQWRQWQEARAAQVPLLFTIQMIGVFFVFFFCIRLSFFSAKKDKVRACTHYTLGWRETLVKCRKIKCCRKGAPWPPAPIHFTSPLNN